MTEPALGTRCVAIIENSHQCRNRARPDDAYCGTCRNAITRRAMKAEKALKD